MIANKIALLNLLDLGIYRAPCSKEQAPETLV